MDKFIELDKKFASQNFSPLPVVLTKGKGVWVWDDQGNKYLDMVSALSVVSHGHAHPKLIQALYKQAKRISVISRAFYSDMLGPFLKELCEITGMDVAMPMNTGAEAAETAIKAARKWGYDVKGIKEDQAEIIVVTRNFHGRTISTISASTNEKYKKGFGPLTPGFKTIPFGSIEALKKAINKNTCAFMVEPIQGEAGIIIPPKGFLKQAAAVCKKHNVLFILDEIQSGLGRAGKHFAFQHENAKPDCLILGKALGGGLIPVSAFLAKREVMNCFTPGTHGSTFGGNPLAAAVGLEAIRVLKREKLAENSHKLGKYFIEELKKMKSPWITDIRGRGLWIGVDFDPKRISGRKVCDLLMEQGILAKETHEKTVRFAPPLVITKKEIDWALQRIKKALRIN